MIEEYITIAYNFKLPVELMVGSTHVNGFVEQINDDDNIVISGQRYVLQEIDAIVS
ncbi:hypothetical protein [Cohnella soli]|uniref:DUF2642 domain-containing protein n=1 Tax=Cohnella soli TaxID=425005 RepID=A0ABW0HRT9_9BACL